MSWNNGYVSDIEYPAIFLAEQSPVHLNFTCVLNGVEPVALDAPFTYCELGCGPGLTATALAASNPRGQFYACDFMPAHIAEARGLASAAALDNLTLLENSFADLARGDVDLPQFDFVSMYGVYGWVNDDNRRHIVDFLARYVKPGGVVHVNYNTQPGWAEIGPLQKLILEIDAAGAGTRAQRCAQVREYIDELSALQARYFTDNASASMKERLGSIQHDNDAYIAHEYMSDGPRQLYHADVARQLAGAGLAFIGQTDLCRSFPRLYLTPEQGALLQRTPPAMRETVADYLANSRFRNDVYVRGPTPLSPPRQADAMQRMGLALNIPRSLAKHKVRLVTGELLGKEELYKSVLDALEQAPRTLADLMAMPAFEHEGEAAVFELAAMLINCGQASSFHVGDDAGNDTALRLNRAMARTPHHPGARLVLVSHVLGSAIHTGTTAQLVYRVLCDMGAMSAPATVAARVLALMQAEGHLPEDEAQRTAAQAEARAAAGAKIDRILQLLVPLWRQLKML